MSGWHRGTVDLDDNPAAPLAWERRDDSVEVEVAKTGLEKQAGVTHRTEPVGGHSEEAWLIGKPATDNFYLSDEAVDWIEKTANDE